MHRRVYVQRFEHEGYFNEIDSLVKLSSTELIRNSAAWKELCKIENPTATHENQSRRTSGKKATHPRRGVNTTTKKGYERASKGYERYKGAGTKGDWRGEGKSKGERIREKKRGEKGEVRRCECERKGRARRGKEEQNKEKGRRRAISRRCGVELNYTPVKMRSGDSRRRYRGAAAKSGDNNRARWK
ncbi:hypothetical protein KM043_012111 [Ampulex compressa]|nr:hypothetical protein KM043_012111 [Ampulex compressa]